MRNIAVAVTEEGKISSHMGRTTHVQVYSLENDAIRAVTTLRVGGVTMEIGQHRHGAGHQDGHGAHHGHQGLLGALEGCDTVLAGGMGAGIAGSLSGNGITPVVVVGEYTPEAAVLSYVAGTLTVGEIHACCGHGHGNGHAHGHTHVA